jgi:hypothetical protein
VYPPLSASIIIVTKSLNLLRKIENKGESPLQSDNRSDEKHSMAPNDPDSGDPQSIPIDNYTGSSPRKNMGSEDIPVTTP